ncbi:MAG: hypothetical protein KAT77_00410 [Nanoarchaeota archaeon]|nr:hypothetical protein [Nanoarchaeota archaeon]
MKKIIFALLLIGLVLIAGCGEKMSDMEISRREALQQEINDTITECSVLEDEFDNSFCFAQKAAKSRQMELEYDVDYPFDMVKAYCSEADDPDVCYYYVAIRSKNSKFCSLVEDRVGCELLSDKYYCNDMINPNECLMDRAYLIRYVDRSEAWNICKRLPTVYHRESEDSFTCLDIDFENSMNGSYEDRFLIMYFISSLIGFEIDYVRVPR